MQGGFLSGHHLRPSEMLFDGASKPWVRCERLPPQGVGVGVGVGTACTAVATALTVHAPHCGVPRTGRNLGSEGIARFVAEWWCGAPGSVAAAMACGRLAGMWS